MNSYNAKPHTFSPTPSQTHFATAAARLANAMRGITVPMRKRLEELKAESKQIQRSDFVWHFLLQSFSTMGNSRGYKGLMLNSGNYQRVGFDVIAALPPNQRTPHIHQVLAEARVRMPARKAGWLTQNHDRINTMGGLAAAREQAMKSPGAEAKIRFMRQFAGIGEKYARNIWMDVYHPEFRNHIAVDQRIKKVSERLSCRFPTYAAEERFYLDAAKQAGLDGWELDRLLYNYLDYFLDRLK